MPSLLQKEEEIVVAESKTTSRTARGLGDGTNEIRMREKEERAYRHSSHKGNVKRGLVGLAACRNALARYSRRYSSNQS